MAGEATEIEVEQALAVAVTALVPVPMQMWSTRAGLEHSLTLSDGALIRVCAIIIDQSSPVATVLHQRAAVREWVIPDAPRVIRLADADHLLNIGVNGFCKILHDKSFNERYLVAFRNFATLLLAVAADVGPTRLLSLAPLVRGLGGDLLWSVTDLCRRCRWLVTHGLDHSRSEEWVLTEVDQNSARMTAMRAAMALLDPPL